VKLRVPPEAAGERLDRYLAAVAGSRAQAQRLIELGAVTLDGRPPRKGERLAGGEEIKLDAPAPVRADSPGPKASFEIRYEDPDLLVVEKPAGVVVHPAGGHREGTLSQALAAHGAAGGEPWRAGIVHRLDKATSGLLVVAKNEATHRALKEALAARRIVRRYSALVEGRPPSREGTIDAPLGRDRRVRARISIDTDQPREARTHFVLVEALPRASLLDVRLETGRTHQIRAHFLAIGHPVAGDPEYGHAGLYGLRRQFLHAAHISLEQPRSGETIEVDSPLPADLVAALELARGASGRVS
jgi:23S rRNA pseudouridine1911/1915/1917 synthase